MLLFWVGEERWAIAAADVVDMIPCVDLQVLPHSADHLVGLLNYHGEHIPVIDISALVGRKPAPQAMSTRIAVVSAGDTHENALIKGSMKLGLILDRACETGLLSEAVAMPAGHPYIKSTLKGTEGDVVQQLAIAPIVEQVYHRLETDSLALSPTHSASGEQNLSVIGA